MIGLVPTKLGRYDVAYPPYGPQAPALAQIGATVGYAQTVAISFTYYFTAGNVITVWAQTDEETPARLYWNPEDPNSQTCYASLNFIGP